MSPPLVAPTARLIDGTTGTVLDGARLTGRLDALAVALDRLPPGIVLLPLPAHLDAVLRYLASLRAGRPVLPLDPALPPASVADLAGRFGPAAVVGVGAGDPPPGYRRVDDELLGAVWVRLGDEPVPAHPDLAVLLATSGSTGQPRLVRLARTGLGRHSAAIADALRIDPGHVGVTALPLFYTYGLSVLHSHLAAGAGVVVVDGGLLAEPFWSAVRRYGVTTVAGVPHHFRMLERLRWRPDDQPSLRWLTVSGGRMPEDLALRTHTPLQRRGGGLFVMYGQTEAGSRITVLPPERLADKPGSVGVPVPGTTVALRTADGVETTAPDLPGEVVCRGPGVMMGYAEDAASLAQGDGYGGVLRTGDLGRFDRDGYLWLNGRANRLAKVFGVRVDLDAVEHALTALCTPAAVGLDDTVRIWCEHVDPARRGELVERVVRLCDVHPRGLELCVVERLPRLASGKVDYHAIGTAA